MILDVLILRKYLISYYLLLITYYPLKRFAQRDVKINGRLGKITVFAVVAYVCVVVVFGIEEVIAKYVERPTTILVANLGIEQNVTVDARGIAQVDVRTRLIAGRNKQMCAPTAQLDGLVKQKFGGKNGGEGYILVADTAIHVSRGVL